MARPLRIQFDGAWYHVMNRGIDHNKIFFNNQHREYFLQLLNEISLIYGVEIHAYCLMGNHYHLILHTPRGNISLAMRHLNSVYAQKINFLLNRDGPLFKGRYKAILIGADDYLIRLSKYIHLNPLGIMKSKPLFAYKWSSYPSYINTVSTPDWLITREIIHRFGQKKFALAYKDYVESNKTDDELNAFYTSPKFQPVLGADEYRDFIFEQIKSHSLSAEIIGANNIIIPPTAALILDTVSEYFNVNIHKIKKCSRRVKNPARQAALYLFRKKGGFKLNDIAKIMGNVTYSTISNTISRAQKDKNIMKDIQKIIMKLRKNAKFLTEKESVE